MATLQQLLILAFILLPTITATAVNRGSSKTSSLPPPPPAPEFQEYTHPLHLFGHVLADLGFQDFAAAAPSLSTATAWQGPITVFAPTDSSLLTCPSCSVPVLLQEHTVPGLFHLRYLRTLAFGTKIETLATGRCLTITSTNNASKIFVAGVEVTHPDLFNDGIVVVHGLQGYVSHLSPHSCSLERMTSLSFLTPPPTQAPSFVMRLMLKDAMLRLGISGYSILAVALRVKYAELMNLSAITVFALEDAAILSGGHEYVTDFRFHVVPNRLLLAGDLEHLPAGTVLPTMDLGHELVVTTAGGGGPWAAPTRINYVKINSPDLMYNLKMAVHGLSIPFPRLNLTAVSGLAKIERSAYGRAGLELTGNAAVGYSSSWTAEIEDHYGL
ncbi:Fasciclin-like arabinogalactan protein [Actinidia chinensis var. chinensis]|uniref:Fasciclin-like arabinogalactan protein n=1 Tax=Actinidia chinensis var. chinensis TaxID=1590841 RepID=A0A2R6PGM1_ACTCC|nr:Fasciclin-like arabinogalactan protein [Actinidia chinensis var. chinensis]